jgi:curved DNA-binding protein CbpA
MVYDYYKLLGINEDATSSEIKASFRDAAKKYHPDLNKNNPKASDLFAVINQGYQILSNKRKKTSYDYILAQNKFYDIERNYSNPYAQQVSRSRKYRYSNEEILKRKRKRFELQRKKEAHIVATFRSKAESFPLIYRYSINSLLGLTGLVMGYQNWFVNYIDGMGFTL